MGLPTTQSLESRSIALAAPAQLPALIDRGPFGAVVAVSADPHVPEDEILCAYTNLFTWSGQAAMAYSLETCQAWRLDWKAFSRFCLIRGEQPLPAVPETVCAFIGWRIGLRKKPATIVRAVATIARAHRAAQVANPCENESVRLAKKAMYRALSARQRQARGFVWSEIDRFLALPDLCLRDHRDRALITVAYDTMCRSAEIVAFDIEDFEWMPDGSGTALVKRAKERECRAIGKKTVIQIGNIREHEHGRASSPDIELREWVRHAIDQHLDTVPARVVPPSRQILKRDRACQFHPG